jgi:glycosyltransferase 2 family protein
MKNWKLWVGLVISVLAAWFALQGIAFDKMGDAIARMNWFWVVVSYIPFAILLLLKVTRWQLLFPEGIKVPLRRLWATLMISYLFNTALPARLGEIVRAFALSRSEKISPVRVLSTILVEKILDVMTIVIFLVALLPFVDIPNEIRGPALVLGLGVVGAFVTCILMAIFRQPAERLIALVLRPIPAKFREKLLGFASEVLDALTVLLNVKLSFNLWAQSFLIWTLVMLNYMLVAFALNIPLTFEMAALVTIALNLGMAVPSAPGYIGVFEALVKLALIGFFPGQDSLVLTYGLVLHVLGFLPVVALGMYYSAREGISLSSKVDKKALAADAPEPEKAAVS